MNEGEKMSFIQWLIGLIRCDMRWFAAETETDMDICRTACAVKDKTLEEAGGDEK